jgi:hypothetical protein
MPHLYRTDHTPYIRAAVTLDREAGCMARAIKVFAFATILIWSLLSLGVWALLSLGGDFVYGQLDWLLGGDPDVVPGAAAVFRFFQNIGLGLVFIVWAIGSLAIWILATIMRRLADSVTVLHVRETEWVGGYESERPMKDITPPRDVRGLPRN